MTMKDPAEDEIEIVDRIKRADEWAKATGYPAHNYFDALTDLRQVLSMLRQSQAREAALKTWHEAAMLRASKAEARAFVAESDYNVMLGERNALKAELAAMPQKKWDEATLREISVQRFRAESAESRASSLEGRLEAAMKVVSAARGVDSPKPRNMAGMAEALVELNVALMALDETGGRA